MGQFQHEKQEITISRFLVSLVCVIWKMCAYLAMILMGTFYLIVENMMWVHPVEPISLNHLLSIK